MSGSIYEGLDQIKLNEALIERSVAYLEAGLTPLRNHDKRCFVEGWPEIEVTEEWLRARRIKDKQMAIGLRVEGHLYAIDVDTKDQTVADEVYAAIAGVLGEERVDAMPMRHSGKAGFMLFAWTERPEFRGSTPKFRHPGDESGETHQVEFFGGASPGRQVGIEGAHTVEDGQVTRWYEWEDGVSLLDAVRAGTLPVLTELEVIEIGKALPCILGNSLELEEIKRWVDDHHGETLFDLSEDTVFVTPHGEMTYDQLEPGVDSVRMKEITGEGTNTSRGRVYDFDAYDAVGVWDSETDCVHLPTSAEPSDIGDALNTLYERLCETQGADRVEEGIRAAEERDAATRAAEERSDPYRQLARDLIGWRVDDGVERPDPEDLMDDARERVMESGIDPDEKQEIVAPVAEMLANEAEIDGYVRNLLRRYFWYGAPVGSGGDVFDALTGQFRGFQNLIGEFAPYARRLPKFTQTGLSSSAAKTNPMTVWRDHHDRVTVSRVDFDPAIDALLTESRSAPGTYHVNIYRDRTFEDDPMPADEAGHIFECFLMHLFPDEVEREWFLNHFAHKVQHPDERGQAVIMISPSGRAGRSTFLSILREMFDAAFVRTLGQGDILGSSSRWSAWQETAVIATMDEITPDPTHVAQKKDIGAALDDLVDTMPLRKRIEEKGQPLRNATVFWTLYAATNHENAIPIAYKDKRFTVLSNTNAPLADAPVAEMLDGVRVGAHRWKENFLHGLWLWLQTIETDRERFMRPLETEAKMTMMEHSEGVVLGALRLVLRDLDEAGISVAWLKGVIDMTRERLDSAYVKTQVKSEVRKALRVGFEGWFYDPNKMFRVTEKGSENRDKRVRGVVENRDKTSTMTPAERAEQLKRSGGE